MWEVEGKMPVAWNLFSALCLRTSPTAHSRDRAPAACHISSKTWEDSELCPVETCSIQNFFNNIHCSFREKRCFGSSWFRFWSALPEGFQLNLITARAFKIQQPPFCWVILLIFFMASPSNFICAIASLTLVPSSSAKPSNLKSYLQFHSFSMANMKTNLSSMPTLFSLLLATSVTVLSDLLTLALNYPLTISLRAWHSELLGDVKWFLFHFASHTAWEGNLSPTLCSEHHAWSRLWTGRVWESPGRASVGLLILSDSVLKAHIVGMHSQVSHPAHLRLPYRNFLPLFMASFCNWNVGISLPQMWVMVTLKWAQNAWLPRSGHLSPCVWAQILTRGGTCTLLKKDDQIQGCFGGQDYLSCLFS